MRVHYDADVDVLTVTFLPDTPALEGDEIAPDVILHIDANGNPVRLEILDASKRLPQPLSLECDLAPARAAMPD